MNKSEDKKEDSSEYSDMNDNDPKKVAVSVTKKMTVPPLRTAVMNPMWI